MTRKGRTSGRASRPEIAFLILVLVAGAALRFYGLNWDGGQWLHPDERQIYFVTRQLGWPDSLAQALSPDSPLNPHFFAYGSLPIYLLRLAAALLAPFWSALRDSGNLHLAGRPLAVLFDLGTVYLTYRLARSLWPLPRRREEENEGETIHFPALLAAALVSLAVIHVQLAHFYTVDPLLTFFILLTLNLAADVAQGGGRRRQAALGVTLGLALASKVSAIPLAGVVLVAYHTRWTRLSAPSPGPDRPLFAIARSAIPILVLAGVVFVAVQPYVLIDWPTFLDHTTYQAQIARGSHEVPYTIQYAGTLPVLYSMWQTALWGLALPLGLVAWGGFAFALVRWLRQAPWTYALLLAWAGLYFAITGLLYARHLRYMLPLTPILCILAVRLLRHLGQRRGAMARHSSFVIHLSSFVLFLLLIASLVYALLFASIYAAPHSWIAASAWIYRQVPPGSTLTVEHWDTALPLPLELDGRSWRITAYDVRTLPLYGEPDDAAKWETLAADLAASDYLIIASRRLYGSIPRLPGRYPLVTRYYDQLFAGNLGFALAGEFTRGPTWLNPRIPPLPDPAPALFRPDESFVVYDHPRVLIFRNAERLPVDELLRRLDAP